MKFLAVKGFDRFQHYRDRNPPWIKLHATLLTDLAFLEMPEAAQAQLVKLWVLASQMGHPLPNKPKLLAGKIGTTGKFYLAAIIAAGFLIPCNEFASTDASGALAESEQTARPSVRGRTQRTEIEDADDDRAPDGPIPEPALTALYLTIWANGAVSEKWGEQPSPFTQAAAVDLADQLREMGVEWQIARLSMYRQCRESRQPRPPRGVNYFRRGIEDDWQAECSRRAVVRSGEQPPTMEQTCRPPTGAGGVGASKPSATEHWTDRKAREEREGAEWNRVRGLVEARKARTDDGEYWWARMKRDAGTTDLRAVYRYAAQHLKENGVAHV